MNPSTTDRLWIVISIAMAIGLHFQPTVQLGSGAVRFSLSDVLVIVVSPIAALMIFRGRHFLNRHEIWIGFGLVLAASVVMTAGLVRANLSSGGVTSWAWVKYIGWYVLLYYGVLGVLAGRFASEKAISWFLQVFVFGHVVLIAAYILTQWAGISWPDAESPRMSGLMNNPNAYGLSVLCAVALVLGAGKPLFSRMPKYSFEIVCGLLCAGVLFTRSLGALGGLIVLAAISLSFQRDIVRIARVSCIALLVYTLPWVGNSFARLAGAKVSLPADSIGAKLSNPDKYAFSLTARIDSNKRALALWRESPVLGAGLGVFYQREKLLAKENQVALQVHNTMLWILVEFGLAGICIFGALFLFVFMLLYRAWRLLSGSDPPSASAAFSGLMILCVWATMSLAHELMYQRVPWLTLGICLGAGVVSELNRSASKSAFRG